jgi:hypothetical protein
MEMETVGCTECLAAAKITEQIAWHEVPSQGVDVFVENLLQMAANAQARLTQVIESWHSALSPIHQFYRRIRAGDAAACWSTVLCWYAAPAALF